MIAYTNVILLIESEIENVISELKISKTETRLQRKRELDQALFWLKKGEQFQIDPTVQVKILPEQRTATPSSEFRIVEDHESDDKAFWEEVNIEGEFVRPMPGDIILLRK